MGGEGVAWTGIAPFTDEAHLFVNMGDGTYFHSGLLAIRAAVAAKVNATYKILFNDAVAMTGGQPHDGELTVPALVRQLQAEGLERVEVVAEDPDRWVGLLPPDVALSHRDELDAVQRRLREIPGVTALVYDQVCAAEKRRRRKRGRAGRAAAPRLHQRRSSARAAATARPCRTASRSSRVDTPLGRKRQINQSSCNTDLSCIKGFCPSFVTVEGVDPRRAKPGAPKVVSGGGGGRDPRAGPAGSGPVPRHAARGHRRHGRDHRQRDPGRGRDVSTATPCVALDQTGLAQKNGAVLSHVRIASGSGCNVPARIGPRRGGRDPRLRPRDGGRGRRRCSAAAAGRTQAVVDRHVVPTAAFVKEQRRRPDARRRLCGRRAGRSTPSRRGSTPPASPTGLLGDAIAANMLLLGFAWQRGLVPVSLDALMTAIELNGVAVAMNNVGLRARASCGARARFGAAEGGGRRQPDAAENFEARLRNRAAIPHRLPGRSLCLPVRRTGAQGGRGRGASCAWPVRLCRCRPGQRVQADGLQGRVRGRPALRRTGSSGRSSTQPSRATPRLRFHLAPPLLSRIDPRTGHPAKDRVRAVDARRVQGAREVQGAARHDVRPVRPDAGAQGRARGRSRSTSAQVDELCAGLSPETHAISVALARLPLDVRGFGHVKQAAAERVEARRDELLAELQQGRAARRRVIS